MIELIFIIKLIAFCYITMGITWTFYLALMHLKEEHIRLKKLGKDFSIGQKIWGYPILVLGYLIDVFLNVTVGTIIFLEIPTEFLFTARVSRWNDTGGWRGDLARWLCLTFLDPFEKGGHCD